MTKPNNPSAFPIAFDGRFGAYEAAPGMSLRDWFATHAPEPPARWWGGGSTNCAGFALWNYQYADAMLSEREKSLSHSEGEEK